MSRRTRFLLIGLFALSAITARPAMAQDKQLYVFAAASLADVLREVANEFERVEGGRVHLNLAGSNTLRVQIEQGLPADIFISANPQNIDHLIESGYIGVRETKTLLSNELVVVVPKASGVVGDTLEDFVQESRGWVALADPETVPAGIYAKDALVMAGLWPDVSDRVVPTLDVRAALLQVENGNCRIGLVYRTDALASSRARTAYVLPPELQPNIRYAVGILKNASAKPLAVSFYDFLSTPAATAIFREHGFKTYD